MYDLHSTDTFPLLQSEDITFRHARRQSEIENEIEREEEPEVEVKAPVSVTPEQVIEFYKRKIAVSRDSNEKQFMVFIETNSTPGFKKTLN